MLEPLPNLPAGVIGFEAVGKIEADDYEKVLRPAIDAATEQGKVHLVYLLGERFEGYSAGASWEDTKLGMHHLKAWGRTALVSDVDWVNHLASMFGWMFPGDFKRFSADDLSKAIAWAAEDAT